MVARPGDVLTEWEFFWEVAQRLGSPLPLAGGPAPMEERPTDDDMLDLAYADGRMSMADIRQNRRVLHPDLAMVVQAADPECTARFTLAPADVAAEISVIIAESDAAESLGVKAEDYPFRLVSRRLKHVLNSYGPELSVLGAKGTTNSAYMNPDDMEDWDLADGDVIEITSPRASLWAVVESAGDIRSGVISMAHSWGGSSLTDEKVRDIGSPTNRLVSVDRGFDPITGMVVQSAIPVRIAAVAHMTI